MPQDATKLQHGGYTAALQAGVAHVVCLTHFFDSHFRLPPGFVTFAAGLEATAVLLLLGAALAGDLQAALTLKFIVFGALGLEKPQEHFTILILVRGIGQVVVFRVFRSFHAFYGGNPSLMQECKQTKLLLSCLAQSTYALADI